MTAWRRSRVQFPARPYGSSLFFAAFPMLLDRQWCSRAHERALAVGKYVLDDFRRCFNRALVVVSTMILGPHWLIVREVNPGNDSENFFLKLYIMHIKHLSAEGVHLINGRCYNTRPILTDRQRCTKRRPRSEHLTLFETFERRLCQQHFCEQEFTKRTESPSFIEQICPTCT